MTSLNEIKIIDFLLSESRKILVVLYDRFISKIITNKFSGEDSNALHFPALLCSSENF